MIGSLENGFYKLRSASEVLVTKILNKEARKSVYMTVTNSMEVKG